VGCVSWCFRGLEAGADPAEAIRTMGELGCETTSLILNAREDIGSFWTDARIAQIRTLLESSPVTVCQFVLSARCGGAHEHGPGRAPSEPGVLRGGVPDRPAPGRAHRGHRGALAWIAEPARRGLPAAALGPAKPRPGAKFRMETALGFDWERVWTLWVETVRECLKRAGRRGLRLSMEHHAHTMVPDSASFLRLWDAVREQGLGCSLDTGWIPAQSEYAPVATHKIGRRLMRVDARDIDGPMRAFVHVGEGVMDFEGVARALKAVGFRGGITLEQDKIPGDMRASVKRFVAMMKGCLHA